jgi:HEAT repeat protein
LEPEGGTVSTRIDQSPSLGGGRQLLTGDEPRLNIERVLPEALALLADPDMRHAATSLLVKLGDPAAVALLNWVHHDDAPIRESATWTLARIKDRRATRKLLTAGAWTYLCVRATKSLAPPSQLLNALMFGSHPTQSMAALALGRLKERMALAEVIELLNSQHVVCRMSALWALGQIGDAGTTNHIHDALDDPDAAVRLSAETALAAIAG